MSATYTNQPGTRDIDTVRLLIDDKDTKVATDAVLTDEEIQFFVDNNSHIYLAAAAGADALVAKYSADASSVKIDDAEVRFGGERVTQAKTLAKQLRSQAARKATPFAGGLTKSGKTAVEDDTDRVQPEFKRGMHKHIRSGQPTDRGVIDF